MKRTIDLDRLRDILPHGLGIDGSWFFQENKDGSVRCSNAWHAMNDGGYYCGWIPFTFTVRYRKGALECGYVRGAFKTNTRANLYLDSIPEDICDSVSYALVTAGSSVFEENATCAP